MSAHLLKIWPSEFRGVADGLKLFEVRKNDRDFKVGDELQLAEFDPVHDDFTGRVVQIRKVSWMVEGRFGLPPGLCVLGWIAETAHHTHAAARAIRELHAAKRVL